MKRIYYLILTLIILICFYSCLQNYSREQEKHIEIFKKYTKYDFPSNSTIIDSYFVAFLDHTYYMIIKTDEIYINKIQNMYPPFSDKWLYGPIPEQLRYGMHFGESKNVSDFGKDESYGNKEFIKLLDSKEIIYSINGSLLEEPYELNVFIIDKKENTIYIGSYSM